MAPVATHRGLANFLHWLRTELEDGTAMRIDLPGFNGSAVVTRRVEFVSQHFRRKYLISSSFFVSLWPATPPQGAPNLRARTLEAVICTHPSEAECYLCARVLPMCQGPAGTHLSAWAAPSRNPRCTAKPKILSPPTRYTNSLKNARITFREANVSCGGAFSWQAWEAHSTNSTKSHHPSNRRQSTFPT